MSNLQLRTARADIDERKVLVVHNVKGQSGRFVNVTSGNPKLQACCEVIRKYLPAFHAAHGVGRIELLQATVLILPVACSGFPDLRACF